MSAGSWRSWHCQHPREPRDALIARDVFAPTDVSVIRQSAGRYRSDADYSSMPWENTCHH